MGSRGIPWHGLREDQSAQKVLLVIALGLAFLTVLGWSLAWMQRAMISLQHELIQELKGQIRGLEERISIRSSLDRHAVALDPADRQRLASLIHRASRRYAIEWHLLVAVVETESAFRPAATSGRGALGLMQLRPSTAAEVARALGIPYGGPADLYDIEVNIRLGTAYLHMLRRRFGSLDLALQAYNIGPARLSRPMISGGPTGLALPIRMDRPGERVGARYVGAVLWRYARLAQPVRIPSEWTGQAHPERRWNLSGISGGGKLRIPPEFLRILPRASGHP
jgi:soluble lytic murein transglycosylase-like protein